ncbi:hypothetical protein QYE76_006037 [Lolium multiflorum]|uniref:F-box domain-containing protein n=1 Tax=Lolium multiflorum TaxID=4521 RepID=A0AAD8RVZ9_LOLMU|nr:hypothetical protein QYE76_006037 [Lolium multiflorum]
MDAIYNAHWVGSCASHQQLFVNILCRLPPSTLAVARLVCHKWHAVIDDNNLLPADYHYVTCGIRVSNYGGHWGSCSIAPTARPWLKPGDKERRHHGAPPDDNNNYLLPSGFSNVDSHWVYHSIARAATSRPKIPA